MPDIRITKEDPLRIFIGNATEPAAGFFVGAAEGEQFITLIVHNGDITGRNIQGGAIDTGQADDINLDIASGNAQRPGWVNFTPDVGKGTRWIDGKGHEMARQRTALGGGTPMWTFDAPVRIKHLYVPSGTGWRKAAV